MTQEQMKQAYLSAMEENDKREMDGMWVTLAIAVFLFWLFV